MLSMDILLGVFCSYLFAASLLKSDAPSLVPVILIITGMYLFHSDPGRIIAFVILLAMASLLGLVHLFPGFFRKHERFGILADAVFILPALIVLF